MEWLSLIDGNWQQWLAGAWLTVQLIVCSLAVGLTLALVITACRLSSLALLRKPLDAFVFVFRGTPLLVQIFVIYYGSGQFAWIKDSWAWTILNSPMNCAVLALALNTAAYTSELFKGAVLAIPRGQVEACLALGLSHWQSFTRVVLPCALRQAIPAYSNEVVMVLKSTSLASTITLMDLLGVTQQIIANTYEVIPCLVIAGVLYLILNALIVGLFRVLEWKFRVLV